MAGFYFHSLHSVIPNTLFTWCSIKKQIISFLGLVWASLFLQSNWIDWDIWNILLELLILTSTYFYNCLFNSNNQLVIFLAALLDSPIGYDKIWKLEGANWRWQHVKPKLLNIPHNKQDDHWQIIGQNLKRLWEEVYNTSGRGL